MICSIECNFFFFQFRPLIYSLRLHQHTQTHCNAGHNTLQTMSNLYIFVHIFSINLGDHGNMSTLNQPSIARQPQWAFPLEEEDFSPSKFKPPLGCSFEWHLYWSVSVKTKHSKHTNKFSYIYVMLLYAAQEPMPEQRMPLEGRGCNIMKWEKQ